MLSAWRAVSTDQRRHRPAGRRTARPRTALASYDCPRAAPGQPVRERDVPRRRPTAGAPPPCACTGSTTTRGEIRSELAWIDALREDGVITTPASVPPATASASARSPMPERRRPRSSVMFEWLPGDEPDPRPALRADFPDAGRAHGPPARPRARLAAAGRVPALLVGLRRGVRQRRALGPMAGRAGHGRDTAPLLARLGRGAAAAGSRRTARAGSARAGPCRPPAGQPAGGRRPTCA